MSTQKVHTEIRQEQLVQAALKLIASEGPKTLSVARVARRIGLVPSAVYRHFESKSDLLDAVLDLIRGRLHSNVSAVCEQTADPLERLRRLLMAHIQVIRENEGILRVIFSEEIHRGRPDQKAKVYEMVKSYLKRVADIISQGQQKGRIRGDVEPGTLSVMFLGLIQPAAILWHLSDGGFDVTKQAERAWLVFSEAIQPKFGKSLTM